MEIDGFPEDKLSLKQAFFFIFPQFIKFPCSAEDVRQTQLDFFRLAGFPKVVAAVDGTHIRNNGVCVALGAAEHLYVNRKGFYSINVQLMCNSNYKITSVSARWPGSTHDSRILRVRHVKHFFYSSYYPYFIVYCITRNEISM